MTEKLKQPAPGSFAHLMSPPSVKDKEQAKKAVGKTQKKNVEPGNPYGRTAGTSVRADVLSQIPSVPEKRHPERYAFQFWADQVTRLKKVRQVLNLTKDPEDRREVTLSDMVRQAVDDYLDKQIKHINHIVRTYE